MPRALRFFDTSGMRPGTAVRVKEVAPFKGTVTLELDGHDVTLGLEVAARVLVRFPEDDEETHA